MKVSVKIVRDSGFLGTLSKMNIFVDGIYCESIKQSAVEYLVLNYYPRRLQVRLFGSKSNSLLVNDGDTVIIRAKKSANMLFISFFLIMIILPIIFTNHSREIFLGIIVLYLLISVFTTSYKLEIIDKDEDIKKKSKLTRKAD